MSGRTFRTVGRPGRAALARAVVEVRGAGPGELLEAFRGLPRGYWHRRDAWCAWAGSAARVVVPAGADLDVFAAVRRWADATAERLEPAVPSHRDAAETTRPRFHGGAVFDPARAGGASGNGRRTRPDRAWEGFGAAAFHLPAVELRAAGGRGTLAVTVERGADEDAASTRAAARRAADRVRARLERHGAAAGSGRERLYPGGRSAPPVARRVRRRPGPDRWAEIVAAALGEIRAGRLRKVVPARMVEVELGAEADPVVLAGRLRTGSPEAIPFLVEPTPGRAFVGAAPEIVAALDGGRFHATAVAGTVADSADPAERERLARRLLSSGKDRREHEVGVRDMRRALRSVTGVATVDEEPTVLGVQGVQHLLTNVTADVPRGTHVLELLGAMHPTAAVNGSPRAEAREFLRREEPFGRGWYAGPVGWFDTSGDGEFAPGLRSALLRGRRVRLFAGAGIVEGSTARDEWRETRLKLATVLDALGVDASDPAPGSAGAAAAALRGAER